MEKTKQCNCTLDIGISDHVYMYDWLRLLLMICVVVGHSAWYVYGTQYGWVDYSAIVDDNPAFKTVLAHLSTIKEWIYGFHMPAFFFLSGGVFRLKRSYVFDELTWKKTKKLIFPYLAVGLFFLLPIKIETGFYSKENAAEAVRLFLGGAETQHLWFLPALFWCIEWYCAVQKLLLRLCIKSETLLLAAVSLVGFLGNYLQSDYFLIKTASSYIIWFALGSLFEKFRLPIRNKMDNPIVIIPLCLLAFMASIIGYSTRTLYDNSAIVINILFVVSLSYLCARGVGEKIILRLVKYSFYIYLFHEPLNFIVLRYFFKYRSIGLSYTDAFVYIGIRTVGVTLVSMAMGMICECVIKMVKVHIFANAIKSRE
ncbi:MAG: acyltransferase [Butyrivibrio sp.]|nr:acyltransferase [Butyrivibrio sp.]